MIRVLVTNIKGGCGKTTLATNLAGAFARGGLKVALADVDRQRSALEWLALRPASAPAIEGVDWRKGTAEPEDGTARLVIDAPANLRMREVEPLIREADLVIVPVLPSLFDEGSTRRFLDKLEAVKPIAKGRKGVLVVANRVRARTKAAQRLESFLADVEQLPTARLADRTLYGEMAVQGLSVFDVEAKASDEVMADWRPLLRAVEDAGA